jgi:RNA polymerase-binding transcription factor DksA
MWGDISKEWKSSAHDSGFVGRDMKARQAEYYEKLLLGRIGRLLSHMAGHSREVLDLEGAQENVCAVCDLPLKPCAVHPGHLCCVALKGGTELFELEAALIRLQSGEYGSCVRCGQEIGKQRLKAYPAAVLCKRCFDATSNLKPRSKTVRRSQANQKAKQGSSASSRREKHRKE